MAKVKQFLVHPYKQRVVFSADIDALRKHVENDLSEADSAGTVAGVWKLTRTREEGTSVTFAVWAEDLPSLVHECVHAANGILDHVGVGVSLSNDEAQAYLIEDIFERCWFGDNRGIVKGVNDRTA